MMSPFQQGRYTINNDREIHYIYYLPQEEVTPNKGVTLLITCATTDQETFSNLLVELSEKKHPFFVLNLIQNQHALVDINTVSVFSESINDFVKHLCVVYDIKPEQLIVIAEGLAALTTIAWVHDYAPLIKLMILLSPTLLAKNEKFSDTIQRLNHFTVKNCTKDFLDDIVYTSKRIIADAAAIYTPTRLIAYHSMTQAEQLFLNELSSVDKSIHSVNLESTEESITNIVFSLVSDHNTHSTQFANLRSAHLQGKTKDELDRFVAPESNFLKKIHWFIQRIILRHIGKLSKGAKIGLDYGFDSGVSLDYIYQNSPQGKTFIHRWLDNYYLDQRGFDATRCRKRFVELLLLKAINQLFKEGKPVNILDIAAGNARYLINFITQNKEMINHVLMRDFDDYHIKEGQALLNRENLSHLVDFEWGDGFSEASLNTLPKNITVTVASGFYELFSNNDEVIKSLTGIANAMELGSYLIITTKIWNPRLEYMARVMTSQRDGDAWALRRRYQLEIDQLASEVGFIKDTQCVDKSGIFTVALYKLESKKLGFK